MYLDEAHTTALAISLVEDDRVQPVGGGTVVFLVDSLENGKKELEEKQVEFIGEIYADEILKLIKFQDPAGNHLQLVEVLAQD
ncbi:MAG: VOC family protein [Candidatus Hodarchaeota archaeon]